MPSPSTSAMRKMSPTLPPFSRHRTPLPNALPEERRTYQFTLVELMIVVAYGLLLPEAVLSIPSLGCINVHASLLPRWRGAAPIQRAILAGDRQTGITIMQMDKGLDTGDMLLKLECNIEADDTAGTLHDRLSVLGARAIVEAIDTLASSASSDRRVLLSSTSAG